MHRHPLDLFSLIAGLLVVGFAAAMLLGALADWTIDGRIALPLVLVGLGIIGLVAGLVAQRRVNRAHREPIR